VRKMSSMSAAVATMKRKRSASSRHFVCSALSLAVVAICLNSQAAVIREDFSTEPTELRWKIFGASSLFRWNTAAQNLEVTWDSSRTNSYFYRSVGTVLAKDDTFSLSFDLQLHEVSVGLRPDRPFTFQLAVGFLNWRDATNLVFQRGTGTQSPNLVEFDYFPDSGFGATISPAIVSSNRQFIASFSFPLELTPRDFFAVALNYSGTNQTLTTVITRNGQAFGPIKDVILPTSFADFRVDTLAICSYSDAGSGGSILARGTIDNIVASLPAPPLETISARFLNQQWSVEFTGRSNWLYVLERSSTLVEWSAVASLQSRADGRHILRDENSAAGRAFYRVRAERP
jgi:hypothetical protein